MIRHLRPSLIVFVLVLAACAVRRAASRMRSGDSGRRRSGRGAGRHGRPAAPRQPLRVRRRSRVTRRRRSAAPATAAPPAHEAGSDDTAGVTDYEIVIGIHAPVTGASPIPQTSFDIGKDIYWKFLAESAPDQLFGRKVRVVFRDDEFNPNRAVSVCREMVEQEGAFMLVGGGGADQITACAQYADRERHPVPVGRRERGGLSDLDVLRHVADLRRAGAAADRRGAGAGLHERRPRRDRHPVVRGRPRRVRGRGRGGRRLDRGRRPHQQDGDRGRAALDRAGAEGRAASTSCILLSSPVVFIGLANQARNQGYDADLRRSRGHQRPERGDQLRLPGRGQRRVLLADPRTRRDRRARPRLQPGLRRSTAAGSRPTTSGSSSGRSTRRSRQMFEATGQELGRAAFMNTLESAPASTTASTPGRFTADDHFGGTGAHLLEADCDLKQFTTAEQFVEAELTDMREALADRSGLLVGARRRRSLVVVVLLAAGEKESLVIGTITGAAYGLVALGLVLIYKSSGVFNFAQGEFGTVALYVLYLLHFEVPYGVAVVGALVAAVLMGLLVERLVIRPLFDAPRVTLLVATAGVALLAVAIEIWFGGAQGKADRPALPTLDRFTSSGCRSPTSGSC